MYFVEAYVAQKKIYDAFDLWYLVFPTLFACFPTIFLLLNIHLYKKPMGWTSAVLVSLGIVCLFFWLGLFPFQKPLQIGEYHFEGALIIVGQWLVVAIALGVNRLASFAKPD
jgi:hypothetical protein